MLVNRKAQVMPFLVLLILILFLAISATYRLGDVAMKKLRLVNAVDGAVISGASELCRGLNRIRQANVGGRGNPTGGPGDGMFIRWLRTQVVCLSSSIFESPFGCIYAWLEAVHDNYKIITGHGLFDALTPWQKVRGLNQLESDITRSVRSSIYDRLLGAFIDEPKPMKRKDDGSLDYDAWPTYGSYFEDCPRHYQVGNPEGNNYYPVFTGDGCPSPTVDGGELIINFRPGSYMAFKKNNHNGWFNPSTIAYYWNRTAKLNESNEYKFIPGTIAVGGVATNPDAPSLSDYDAFFEVGVGGGSVVRIKYQFFFVFYFLFGFPIPLPFPNAWISGIEGISYYGSSLGGTLSATADFEYPKLLLAGGTSEEERENLEDSASTRIYGNTWWWPFYFQME